jgi:hypothetical protein
MKTRPLSSVFMKVSALVFALVWVPTFVHAATEAPKVTNKMPVARLVPEVPIPQSLFVIPAQPSEGRNPFFPQSVVHTVVPAKVTKDPSFDWSVFVLNGITSPPKRTAMINGRTFEANEEGEVRLNTGGRMLIKCEAIKADSAIITVGGQIHELRLRSGL